MSSTSNTNTNNSNNQEMQNYIIGTKFFRRYEIKEKIHTGSKFDIYKSVNINNKEEFAIKIIKNKKASNFKIPE